MKCEDAKLLFMDYLYEELEQENVMSFENHMKNCEQCASELASLQQTQKIFHTLPEVEPTETLVFHEVQTRPRFAGWRQLIPTFRLPQLSFARLGVGLALAMVGLLVIGSLTNLEVKYKDSEFAVKMSLFPKAEQQLTPELREELLAQLREENNAVLTNYMQEQQLKNERKLDVVLASYTEQLERQRQNDLKLIGRGMDVMRQNQDSRFNEYEKYIKSASFPQK